MRCYLDTHPIHDCVPEAEIPIHPMMVELRRLKRRFDATGGIADLHRQAERVRSAEDLNLLVRANHKRMSLKMVLAVKQEELAAIETHGTPTDAKSCACAITPH